MNTSGFTNTVDSPFTVGVVGNQLVLSYVGNSTYVWTDRTGNLSANANWLAGTAPPVQTTNVIAYFGGSTSGAYYARNDLTNLVFKQLVLTNNQAGVVQTLTGNSLTFAGAAPRLDQNGGGAFDLSNDLLFASSVIAGGSGLGTVALLGDIRGPGGLTKIGSGILTLGAASRCSTSPRIFSTSRLDMEMGRFPSPRKSPMPGVSRMVNQAVSGMSDASPVSISTMR